DIVVLARTFAIVGGSLTRRESGVRRGALRRLVRLRAVRAGTEAIALPPPRAFAGARSGPRRAERRSPRAGSSGVGHPRASRARTGCARPRPRAPGGRGASRRRRRG